MFDRLFANIEVGDSRRALALLSVLGLVVLTYVGGAFSAAFRTFPYPQLLEKPFRAIAARQKQRETLQGVVGTGLWQRAEEGRAGVDTRVDGEMYGSLTLYTSSAAAGARLVDASGEVVHEWNAPFHEVWPNAPHIDGPVPPEYIYWRRVHLFPDGDIIASYTGKGDTPYGYGLARFDRNSELLWKYDGRVHHDFDVRPDGSIVALTQQFRSTKRDPIEGAPHYPEKILEDFVVVLSPEGEEQKRVSVLEALESSSHRELLKSFPRFIDTFPEGGPNHFRRTTESSWDPLHTNTANVVGEDFAEHHAFAEPGHVMISFRNIDTIALMDLDAEKVVWAARSYWKQQHDPDPLGDGTILVYDNNGAGGPGGASRLLQFDPATNEITWTYRGTPDAIFWSANRGAQQPLPNGNVLVTDSNNGRIFETTRQGRIVWDFYTPEYRQLDGEFYNAIVCGALRFRRDELTFL